MIRFDFNTSLNSIFVASGLLVSSTAAWAAPPWQTLAPFKRVESDPNQAYPVAEDNGPWMIIASSFHGEGAEKRARELVHELRSKYRIPAYTYKQHFDFTGLERGKGFNRHGGPKMMKYQSGGLFDEVAVLVGDYDTVDDPRAERTLQKIKYLQPESIRGEQAKTATESTASSWRERFSFVSSKDNRKKGPMAQAFVATNPLLPKEYFASPGIDKLVLEMNQGVEHSLLNCPGKYTVKVATFNGAAVVDQKKINEIEKGKKLGTRLADAAENAHKLTQALRKQGEEAYEFHDRDKSVVCVGSFKRLGIEYSDGRQEMDPQVRQVIQRFTADPEIVKQAHAASQGLDGGKVVGDVWADSDAIRRNLAPKPRMYDGVPLDVEPQPFEVPKRSIGAAYQRSMRSDF
ncbi:MAG: hypothetical protein IT427_14130 [Pirellulales bacterium]|nr:hypothetical protein [Pirellulales bacterium]